MCSSRSYLALSLIVPSLLACDPSGELMPLEPNACVNEGTAGATARCQEATLPPEYYVDEAQRYFDTLDITAPEDSIPDYHEQVARWEWPPWLKLTGYSARDMIDTAVALRRLDPSTVPTRDCRFFEEQPFARCYVVFEYEGGECPIYEEFTFNAAGEMTFIEAWSDLPELLPQDRMADMWAEAEDYPRLANKVPGLGTESGTIELGDEYMLDAAARDEDVADFVERAADWRVAWGRELFEVDPNFFAIGCGWPIE